VLKGVVRVENLPQPSEHVPALLERVKPIYISRTYGIPLPTNYKEEGFRWEAEDLLEKLARMKGRLLKGGEPDIEGVAKIVLNDWVRGRLPFFVAPPERPEERTMAENKSREGVKELKPVPQKLRGIIQKNKFEGDDIQPLEEDLMEGTEEEDDTDGTEDSSDAKSGNEEDDDDDDEGALEWDDVFEAVVGRSEGSAKVTTKAVSSTTVTARTIVDDDEEEDVNHRKKQKKDPRMTTSKKKATNFFTEANVKNRNRERVLPKAGRGRNREGRAGNSAQRR
jgi:nuclear GTP-binding protein